MPSTLVEFFVKFLTDEGDTILDPFAGSNTTGAEAQKLGRRWLSVEAEWQYAAHSIGRFDPRSLASTCEGFKVSELKVEGRQESERGLVAENTAEMPLFATSPVGGI